MHIRVFFLLLVNLLFILPTYTSCSELREALPECPPNLGKFLQVKVSEGVEAYNQAHRKQSSVYPKCDAFTDAYAQVKIITKKTMINANKLLTTTQNGITPSVKKNLDNISGDLNPFFEYPSLIAAEANKIWELLKGTPTSSFAGNPKVVAHARKNFGQAIELLNIFDKTVTEVRNSIRKFFPDYEIDICDKAARVLIALCDWKNKAKNIPFNEFHKIEFINDVLVSIHKTGKINLVQFVCPNVDFSLLSSSSPEEYFISSVENSLFSKQKNFLIELVKNLRLAGIPVNLCLMIGDDEDCYFWPDEKSFTSPVFEKPHGLTEANMTKRREEFRLNVQNYTRKHLEISSSNCSEYPPVTVEVHNLYDKKTQSSNFEGNQQILREVLINSENHFTTEDFELEKERMKQLAGDYYRKLFDYFSRVYGLSPEKIIDNHLAVIVRAKFATYALDGLIAYECSPYAILLQTEFPAQLRTKMMNMGRIIRDKKAFSVIYLSSDKTTKKIPSSPREIETVDSK